MFRSNKIYAICGGVIAALIVVVGGFLYVRSPANPGVPPLPASARMFNNWALIGCGARNDGVRCVLLSRAVDQQARRVVMQMTIARAQNGAAVMAITLPPNVGIASGVILTPMGGTAAKGTIRTCVPQGCTGTLPVSDTLAKELAATNTAALEFVAANGRSVRMNANIRGFAQGFAAWQAAAPASVSGAAGAPTIAPNSDPAAARPAGAPAKAGQD